MDIVRTWRGWEILKIAHRSFLAAKSLVPIHSEHLGKICFIYLERLRNYGKPNFGSRIFLVHLVSYTVDC